MKALPADTAVIVIDHGSRMDAANTMLDEVAALFQRHTGASIVEPAHMELASPTLEEAAAKCIQQGARTIVVHPYFLAPGRHSTGDIPSMVEALKPQHPEVRFVVTGPLGVDDAMAEIMHRRVAEALGLE